MGIFSVSLSLIIFLSISTSHGYRYWDDLTVTNFNTFTIPRTLPLSQDEARWMGWSKQDSECGGNKDYQGYAWTDESLNDTIAILFDVNGFVAGMQARITKVEAQKIRVPSPAQMPPFLKDPIRPFYYIVIYFIEPDRICGTGRTRAEFKAEGTGTDVIILNGDKLMRVPKYQPDIRRPWVPGQCYITLGSHYWYNMYERMSRDTLFPVVPIYNGLDLNGFGIAYSGALSNQIYAHPTGSGSLVKFMRMIPSCFEESTFSMYQIFFTSNLWLNFC